MVALTHNSLIYSENLTLPTFQVIVMNANMGCAQCRQRVSQVTSKIKGEEFNPVNYIFNIKPRERILNGLREYTVDVPNKQVTVKGDFGFGSKLHYHSLHQRQTKSACFPSKFFFKSFRAFCFTKTFLRI
ncbi:hypothetical protein Pint_15882 [Pistacia integerrima]|uniref:Uncharacterized protein n=1 Tax=Pistacia integerrima TaxID=434235 RepID=A0ACC0ZGT0_9ROSI|nr:hypothetical protein Pint_15882 [Pistacia integerrima]